MTVSESQTVIIDIMSGGVTTSCATEYVRLAMAARAQRHVGDGQTNDSDRRVHGRWGVRGQSKTEIAQKEPAHGYQWNREGHPCAIPREQAQAKLKDRRAKTECQIRDEWGHHAPNRRVMETSSKDRARTSHLAGRCRVEKQAGTGGTGV